MTEEDDEYLNGLLAKEFPWRYRDLQGNGTVISLRWEPLPCLEEGGTIKAFYVMQIEVNSPCSKAVEETKAFLLDGKELPGVQFTTMDQQFDMVGPTSMYLADRIET